MMNNKMDEINFWPRVTEFIERNDSLFLSKSEGVPEDALPVIPLPTAYVTFLRLMGANSDGFQPFGPTQDHHFSTITKRMNHSERYFPVSIETDKSYDYYLDLQHSNGRDAPLQRFEQIIPLDEDAQYETNETFCERIISSVFYHFGLRHIKYRDEIHVHKPDVYQNVLSLLLSMGFMPAMPLLERVSCLQSGPFLLLVEATNTEGILTLNFGSSDAKAIKTLRNQLLSHPLIKPS